MLDAAGVESPPVDVVRVSKAHGVQVRQLKMPVRDNVAMFCAKAATWTIGVNRDFRASDRRHAAALGLARIYEAHRWDKVFVDQQSEKTPLDEKTIRALKIAACLLVPRMWVLDAMRYSYISTMHINSIDIDKEIRRLARRFGVREATMIARLAALGVYQ